MAGIEGYQLVRRIAAGGMGTVHEALDADGRRVAIKIIHDSISDDPAARQRLHREVELLHRVKDERVARVLDAEVDAVEAFIVTELVEGPTLEEHVQRHGPLAGDELAGLAGGLADGLAAIHAAGITHRDLKPGNVMLAPTGPVIIDFGIAQVADDVRLTQTGMITGTPGYLDPDVIAGADPGPDGDWWAWAAVLVFAATGRPPFGRGTIATVLARVSTGLVDTAGLPDAAGRALRAALDPEPRRRLAPADLRAVLEGTWGLADLTAVLAERPPAAATRAAASPPRTPLAARRPAPDAAPRTRAFEVPPGGGLAPGPAAHPPPWPGQQAVPPGPGAPSGGDPAVVGGAEAGGHDPSVVPGWARPPARRGVSVAVLGLALSVVAARWPGVVAVVLGVLLVALGAVGRGSRRLRAGRLRRGLRRGDAARAWAAGPWHLLWALVAALPGLLIGGALGASLWWLTHYLARPEPSVWHWLLWAAAFVVVALAWLVPPSAAARDGARLVLHMLPAPARTALTLLALATLGALVTDMVVGSVPDPVWAPFPAPSVPA